MIIDLKQLLIVILIRWRVLLFFLLLGTIGGGLYYYSLEKRMEFGNSDGISQDEQIYINQMVYLYDSYNDMAQEMLNRGVGDYAAGKITSFEELDNMLQVLLKMPSLRSQRDALKEPVQVVASDKKTPLVVLAGALVGLVMGASILAVYYILSGVVLSLDELHRRYGIRPLSVITRKNDNRIMRFGRDGDLLKMTNEEQIKIAIANISGFSQVLKGVLLTGTVNQESLISVSEDIKKTDSDMILKCAPNVYKSAASYELLKDSTGVILVESILSSKYSEIDKEIQLFSDWGKSIIGVIAII